MPDQTNRGAVGADGGRVRLGAILATIAALIGIVGGAIAVWQFVQNRVDRFEGDVTHQATADRLVNFATGHDARVVWLNLTCRASTAPAPACDGNTPPPFDEQALLPIHASSGRYWLHIYTAGSDVQADNGPYGAGSLVVKGYFTISVRGVLGSDPPDVQNVDLHGVSSSSVRS